MGNPRARECETKAGAVSLPDALGNWLVFYYFHEDILRAQDVEALMAEFVVLLNRPDDLDTVLLHTFVGWRDVSEGEGDMVDDVPLGRFEILTLR